MCEHNQRLYSAVFHVNVKSRSPVDLKSHRVSLRENRVNSGVTEVRNWSETAVDSFKVSCTLPRCFMMRAWMPMSVKISRNLLLRRHFVLRFWLWLRGVHYDCCKWCLYWSVCLLLVPVIRWVLVCVCFMCTSRLSSVKRPKSYQYLCL